MSERSTTQHGQEIRDAADINNLTSSDKEESVCDIYLYQIFCQFILQFKKKSFIHISNQTHNLNKNILKQKSLHYQSKQVPSVSTLLKH